MKETFRSGCVLCLVILLLTTAWHEAGTSIGRYHYMLIPFVFLLTGMLLPDSAEILHGRNKKT